MLVYDGEKNFRTQLAKIDDKEERIIEFQEKVTDNHKDMVEHQKKLKPILEGMEP